MSRLADPSPPPDFSPHDAQVTDRMRSWLERAVIGLNLCPFAKAVHVKNQIRYVVSSATTPEALQAELADELRWLAAADPQETDTTLLIHPQVLQDFLDYNDFLDVADAAITVTAEAARSTPRVTCSGSQLVSSSSSARQ